MYRTHLQIFLLLPKLFFKKNLFYRLLLEKCVYNIYGSVFFDYLQAGTEKNLFRCDWLTIGTQCLHDGQKIRAKAGLQEHLIILP